MPRGGKREGAGRKPRTITDVPTDKVSVMAPQTGAAVVGDVQQQIDDICRKNPGVVGYELLRLLAGAPELPGMVRAHFSKQIMPFDKAKPQSDAPKKGRLADVGDDELGRIIAAVRDAKRPGTGADPGTGDTAEPQPVEELPAVPEASSLPWAWPDISGEVASRGQSAGQDAGRRDGNGNAPHGPLPAGVAGSGV